MILINYLAHKNFYKLQSDPQSWGRFFVNNKINNNIKINC